MRKFNHILLGPIGLRVVLALYCFVMLTVIHFISIARNGSYHLIKEHYIILFCWLVILEVLNQVTFWLGRKNYTKATAIKCAVFWITFSCATGAYLYFLLTLNQEMVYPWHKDILHILLYLISSVIMSHYSLIPEFRFLICRGKFQKSTKTYA